MKNSTHSGWAGLPPQLLVDYQAGHTQACRKLPGLIDRALRRLVKHIARDLPLDLHDDVVQEVWYGLTATTRRYDPALSKPVTYVYYFVREAVRRVRADITPAGESTRPTQPVPPPTVDPVDSAITPVPEDPIDVEEAAGVMFTAADTEAAAEVSLVLDRVHAYSAGAAKLAAAFDIVYEHHATWSEAAQEVGISRDALLRLRLAFARHTGIVTDWHST